MAAITVYANTGGSNTSPYDTFAKGATDLQTAIDYMTNNGDPMSILKAYGTFQPSAAIDFNGVSGANTTGRYVIQGVNSSGDNDGTKVVIDGDANSLTNCIHLSGEDGWWLENIDLWGASGDGIDSSAACSYFVFNNFSAHSCNMGIDAYNFNSSLFFRCSFYENTSDGLYPAGLYNAILFSSFHSNGSSGLFPYYMSGVVLGCIIANNSGGGSAGARNNLVHLFNSVDGNTGVGITEGFGSFYNMIALFNRITKNSTYGFDFNSIFSTYGFNYLEDNTSGNYTDNSVAVELGINGTGYEETDNADTNEGYASAYGGGAGSSLRTDYGLSTGTYARGSRLGITVPMS